MPKIPSPAESYSSVASPSIAFTWLLFLRWGAVACQSLIILFVYLVLEIEIPLFIVSVILAFQGLSNLFFFYLQKKGKVTEWLFALVMFLDVVLLTFLLAYTGGPMNPFTFLYLVHIVLAAILLRPKWSWGVLIFTVLCYASFFIPTDTLSSGLSGKNDKEVQELCHELITSETRNSDHLNMHLQGMLVAFAVTSVFIVFFVGRIQRALEKNQEMLTSLKEQGARNEKLASLATLAAGAAHEFSTPLATIAVAAGEMLHNLKKEHGQSDLIEDARLIREQVNTCKEILFQMSADAGEHLGEGFEEMRVSELIEMTLKLFADGCKRKIQFNNNTDELIIKVPKRTIMRTIKGLLKNAADASEDNTPITLTCQRDNLFLYLEVVDTGSGMDSETLLQACEPFFTTKNMGEGLGLGLYLAKSVAERFGGRLRLISEKGQGTKAVISFSLSHFQRERFYEDYSIS